ncbi:hypothetical protein [Joostella sp. CR20]|uniref:hypothetical protein n=1 Tax=Joostella sp. CR20 TaxID=2804312 RepID=UPI00313B5B2D
MKLINKKLKGGALQFVLFIGVVIAILLLTFISLAYSHQFFQKRSDFFLSAVSQSNNGIYYLLHNDISMKDSVALHLESNEEQIDGNTLITYKRFWGLFEILVSKSVMYHQEFTKVALVGGRNRKEDRYSLFLRENNRPLVVVERAEIGGKLLLPEEGVRPGNIGGKSFVGTLSPLSKIGKSKMQLPKLSEPIMAQVKLWLQGKFDGSFEYISPNYPFSLKKSFKENTQLFYSDTPLHLAEGTLIGNILVYSSSKVYIGKYMDIKDIVIVAPEIEIEEGFKGSLQAIASKEITLNEKVVLEYPSALVVYNTNLGNSQGAIQIENQSLVQGAVLFYDEDSNEETQHYNAQVRIAKEAYVEGEVYCTKGVELLGEVKGTITTSYFVVSKFGSIYQNHIYGGKLNVEQLHERYTGLIYSDRPKKIAKWLY